MKNEERIFIFDTTLRDGQQSPGAGLSFEDNLIYAEYANELGIDILEAGFPAASQHDFDIVHAISEKMSEQKSAMKIAALSQLREEQVIRTMEALEGSLARDKARIHIYVPVDPTLMQASLGKLANNKLEIIELVYRLTHLAATEGFEVEFSPEGYSRMQENFNFTTDVIRAAINAGATVINCPDTIGGANRWQKDYFVNHMQKHASIIEAEFPQKKIIWSAHCHNDFGLALDNTLNAVFSGPARQIEGCINGVGERAGNVPLEQVLLMIKQVGDHIHPDSIFFTGANLKKLKKISDFIAKKMLPRQPHWPITGENATRHSSGGHTNAILKNKMAYHAFDPDLIGSELSFAFGPLSGGNHAKEILEQNGFYCHHTEKAAVAQAIKTIYASRRKGITDDELIHGYQQYCAPIKIKNIHHIKADHGHHRIEIEGQFFDSDKVHIKYNGDISALDMLDKEVKKHFSEITLADYQCQAVDDYHQSTVVINNASIHFTGKAKDNDTHIATLKAYIDAVNQAYFNFFYKSAE